MTLDASAVAPSSPVQSSRVTNGSQPLLWGDGRSRGARRYRDLLRHFSDEVGGFDKLSPLSQQLCRSLASVSVELEAMEAARAAGQRIDPVRFVRSVNAQRRLLRDLRKATAPPRPPPKPRGKSSEGETIKPPSLADLTSEILARREGEG